jgi:hypothetical protein
MLCGGRKTTYATLNVTVTNTRSPVIDVFRAVPEQVQAGGTVELEVIAADPLGRDLTYEFTAPAGRIEHDSPTSARARWIAPLAAGSVAVRCDVRAGEAAPVSAQVTVTVSIGRYAGQVSIRGVRATRVEALPDGRFAAVDVRNGTLTVADEAGAPQWQVRNLATPTSLAVNTSSIFVLERAASRVSVWSVDGRKLREFVVEAALPNDLAIGPGPDELAITDTSAGVVRVVDVQTGAARRTLGAGMLTQPTGIAIASGRIAVTDTAQRRLVVFATDGSPLAILGDDTLFARPQGVARSFTNDGWVVCDAFSGEIAVVADDGSVRGQLGGFGGAAGQLVTPIDVARISATRIAATLGNGTIETYEIASMAAMLAPPAAVSANDRPNDDGGAVAVGWQISPDDPARVTNYRIERAVTDGDQFEQLGVVTAGTASFVDMAAVDGTCYRYRVVATDGMTDAASQPSNCAIARNDLPPAAPEQVTAAASTPFAIDVSWSAVSAPDLVGYDVDVDDGAARATHRFPAAATSAQLTGLVPDRLHTISVRAIDTGGNASQISGASATTWPDEQPAAVASLEATDLATGGAITLSWIVPDARVPSATFEIALTPEVEGWPVIEHSAVASPTLISGLVNRLPYRIAVTATTPWGRTGPSSSLSGVNATAAPRSLPLVGRVGREGSAGLQDAAGFAVIVPNDGNERELRFEYRTVGTSLELLIDGEKLTAPLADTYGEWQVSSIRIKKHDGADALTRILEIRNPAFPASLAEAATRKLDLVPLVPAPLRGETFNSVIDLVWQPLAWRADLVVRILRTDERAGTTAPITCRHPFLGRCRDAFRPEGVKYDYAVAIQSPAGWVSDTVRVSARAAGAGDPPPVTDLVVVRAEEDPAWQLDWTPLSGLAGKSVEPAPVAKYRIYKRAGEALVLLGDVAGPPALVPLEEFDPAVETLLVRSVAADGRESQ